MNQITGGGKRPPDKGDFKRPSYHEREAQTTLVDERGSQ